MNKLLAEFKTQITLAIYGTLAASVVGSIAEVLAALLSQ